MSEFDEMLADIAAFADDDEEVIIDPNGHCLFVRGGRETSLHFSQDDDRMFVEVEGERLPYTTFLTHTLAQLPILAERILAKRDPIIPYIDSDATLRSPNNDDVTDTAIDFLRSQTSTTPAFLSRVVFITADAGQGKTALLREFQQTQAKAFLEGSVSSLFWHVDLQGRQLLRLSEALMGDLGDLRVPGLWMPAIIRLLRRGCLTLAIDGFDELAAEQGGNDALGALARIVHQLEGRGTIVAASRRTFFDTDDYIRRAGMFRRAASDCEFNEIRLQDWDETHAIHYLSQVCHEGNSFDDPAAIFAEMAAELGSANHPILTRPFLLAQVSRGLLIYDLPVSGFIRGMEDPLKGVGTVIEAFVDREVTEKWKQQETGEPFLTREQHLRLLSDVAEEMFRAQSSMISIDVLETITAILLDEWEIDPGRRQQVLEMVRMHVLLTPPSESDFSERSFDHEEFRDWFTAYALKDRLLRTSDTQSLGASQGMLSVAHLPDATARYVCSLFERSPEVATGILKGLEAAVRDEFRPTYLQTNVGTLIPFLMDGVQPVEPVEFSGPIVFTSLVHDGKRLRDITFRDAIFSGASLVGVDWSGVSLVTCNLGELTLSSQSCYQDVQIRDCALEGIRLVDGDGLEETREYAPARIVSVLEGLGIEVVDSSTQAAGADDALEDGQLRKLVRRLLSTFRRTTLLTDDGLQQRFRGDTKRVMDEVVPFMIATGVLVEKQWRGSGRHKAWGLGHQLEDIEKADGNQSMSLSSFWRAIDEADAKSRKLA
jgi:hypothetical protein